MKIICPHCESHLDAPEELHGEIVECPECNEELSVTEENLAPPPPPPPTTPTPETKQTHTPAPLSHVVLKKNNGALYGCWVCLLVALIINYFSNFLVLFWGPLYFAAFVLAIVSIAQRRVVAGIVALLLSIIFPIVISTINIGTRAFALQEAIEKKQNKDLILSQSDIKEKPNFKPVSTKNSFSKPKAKPQTPKPQIKGAFGINLGSFFNPQDALETTNLTSGEKMYKINVPKKVRKFIDYYVLITPKTQKIYSIWGEAKFKDRGAKREFSVIRNLIYKKYNNKGKKDMFGDSCTWDIGNCRIYLKSSGYSSTSLEIRYTNNDLEELAKQEFIQQESSKTNNSAF